MDDLLKLLRKIGKNQFERGLENVVFNAINDAADEIEGLCGKITFLREGGEKREEEFRRLRARVEELEKGNEFVGDIDAIVLASQGKYVITNEMIDAAVGIANGSLTKIHPWMALNKLNIFRCEVCKRSPGEQHEWGKKGLQPCANCNGKCYTVGKA